MLMLRDWPIMRHTEWMGHIYAVHATKADDAGAVEVIFSDEQEARAFAVTRSGDHRVLAASVTRYTLGELGARNPIAWYVEGRLQDPRGQRPGGRYYPSAGMMLWDANP